jgi:hypothetical protein
MMRIVDLNLARKPFTNRRLFWVSIIAAFIITSVLTIWISGERIRVLGEINQLEQQKKAKELNILVLKRKVEEVRTEIPQTILTDDQKIQLASARLLISRGSFSWNRLMSDIERFIPHKAFVTSMKIDEGGRVQDSSGGIVARAIVEIKVNGQTAGQMTEMMTALEHSSGLFGVEQATQDPISEDGNIPFTLRLTYKPVKTDGQGGE